jgi:hypothetical protein
LGEAIGAAMPRSGDACEAKAAMQNGLAFDEAAQSAGRRGALQSSNHQVKENTPHQKSN